ncbi:hypothetical protein E1263_04080 [Kribbella antibiotica]|uniref:DUF222 domain-containing protein n=1 Tax=Kribbella antibiotica TaxID=190195 RepID=A0A4R4ZYR0_9ACTN|nr:hypothetical protein [Kribbella antibiotica]TDD62342.1 hypothetical protein E1263_04080 [Kribbella antibiotica]
MFDEDLTALSTTDLLDSVAGYVSVANRANVRQFEAALVYADRFHPDNTPNRPGRRSADGRERSVVLGGEGCPPIVEFAITEFGVMLGVSPRVASSYIGNALGLRHRFPFTWARVLSGEATAWKAARIVADCINLSEEAAAYVDRRIAALIDSITPYRLGKIVRAAKYAADPAGARAEADARARERGVHIGQSDEHGTKTVFIKASAGAVNRYDATIAGIAEALKTFGDTRGLQCRRATAVGIIADPRYTEELLAQARAHQSTSTALQVPPPAPEPVDFAPDDEADRDAPHPSISDLPDPLDAQARLTAEPWSSSPAPDDGVPMDAAAQRALDARLAQVKQDAYSKTDSERASGRPGKTELYVHLTDYTLATGSGVLRAEGIGPLIATQLHELIGHTPYVVKPVIDLREAISVNAYEIPDRIRERVRLAHPVELFPFGTRETHRDIDLDHITAYDPLGPPGQTATDNLAPLGRLNHRVKTHAPGWSVQRINPTTLEWTTPHGFVFHVDPTGTHRVFKDAPGP